MTTLSKRITDLISRAEMDISELASNIDMDATELEKAIQNDLVDVRVLEKIAKELGLSLYTLFPRPAGSVLQEYYTSPKNESLLAKDNPESKIYYLESVIDQLRKENSKLNRCLGDIKSSIQKHGV